MLESVGSVSRAQSATPPQNRGGQDYRIQRGDTLTEIADRFGTDVKTLQQLNDISNPNRIYAGQTITVPTGGKSVTVQRGDTLTEIAQENNTSVAALMKANPEIRNANQIYPGDVVRVPASGAQPSARPSTVPTAGPSTQEVARVGSTSNINGRLSLSPTDIVNIKKTLQTEWVPYGGTAQAHGIIDTILNRTASGHWGSTVANVVNAHNQFSDINGPIARNQHGRNSVEQVPASQVTQRVSDIVDSYLAQRASGTPSSVGTHLNYANPHFSDKKNLPWIMALDGPVLGRGNAIHRHGTTPNLEQYRPAAFAVALPGSTTGNKQAVQNVVDKQANPTRGEFINPTGGKIRSDSGGDGHFNAPRNRKGKAGLHKGLDFAGVAGQPVLAPISGTITAAKSKAGSVLGGYRIVSDDGKTVVSVFYAKLNSGLEGTKVTAGMPVAIQSDLQTNNEYPKNVGDHVHMQIDNNGQRVDPTPYFFK